MVEDRILLVEDEEGYGGTLKDFFEDNGLSVIWAKDGETAIRSYKELNPGLILLDIVLPDKDGFEVATAIRKLNSVVPIIFMTGTALNKKNYDKAYLELGATNYIEKPVNLHNALAQVRSLLHPASLKKFIIGDLYITIHGQQVIINNKEFRLREKEVQVLSLLLEKVNSPVTRRDILQRVWKSDEVVLNNTLDTAISRIRKKLTGFPAIDITTIHAMGYQLTIE